MRGTSILYAFKDDKSTERDAQDKKSTKIDFVAKMLHEGNINGSQRKSATGARVTDCVDIDLSVWGKPAAKKLQNCIRATRPAPCNSNGKPS
jgi:hypothetical protein